MTDLTFYLVFQTYDRCGEVQCYNCHIALQFGIKRFKDYENFAKNIWIIIIAEYWLKSTLLITTWFGGAHCILNDNSPIQDYKAIIKSKTYFATNVWLTLIRANQNFLIWQLGHACWGDFMLQRSNHFVIWHQIDWKILKTCKHDIMASFYFISHNMVKFTT